MYLMHFQQQKRVLVRISCWWCGKNSATIATTNPGTHRISIGTVSCKTPTTVYPFPINAKLSYFRYVTRVQTKGRENVTNYPAPDSDESNKNQIAPSNLTCRSFDFNSYPVTLMDGGYFATQQLEKGPPPLRK